MISIGVDAEQLRELPLKADRDVAEADGAMSAVEQRARDDSHRVREVHDPGAVGGVCPHVLCDVEHDGNGAERLCEAARARRFLADAAASERKRLVREPRRLAADPDLDEHEVGAVDRAVELAGELERSRESDTLEHAARQRADHGQSLGVDVVQHQLADLERRESGHELRRVGRARADDRDLHPFTPVNVTPSTNARCARKNTTITGAMTRSVAAIVRFHCTWCSERYCERPSDTTQLCGLSLR